MAVTGQPASSFADLLRQLRVAAGLTQEELAEAASLSPRSVSALERGVNLTARKETARLLADALSLSGTRGPRSRLSREDARPMLDWRHEEVWRQPPGRCRVISGALPVGSMSLAR